MTDIYDQANERLLEERVKRALRNNVGAAAGRASKCRPLISRDETLARLHLQNCNCAICKKDLEGNKWVVDHCHRTGRIRGLVCCGCNSWLGHNEQMVRVVYTYLRDQV